MDTETLAQNYRELLDYASSASFAPPPSGEWSAEQVVAHLTANDELLLAATLDVLADKDTSYDNAQAIDAERLTALVEECGGMAGVIARLRSSSERIVDAVGRIDDERAGTSLPVKIVDGSEVRVDQPITIAQLYQAQTHFHVPNHLQQLKDLGSAPE